jgi:predicted naringenin-chalcone synthase
MSVFVRHIETHVPTTSYTQEYIEAKMMALTRDRKQQRYIRRVYKNSGIHKRHSVLPDFLEGATHQLYGCENDGSSGPRTGARNRVYVEASRGIAPRLARAAIDGCGDVALGDITHVVTASCTGFFNPGLDYHIVRELGMKDSVQRYHLGFMGCYAAIPALRMARQFCEADPQAVVLVLCLELCTLHMQMNGSLDNVLANSLFADGASCAIVGTRRPRGRGYVLKDFASALIPGGEKDMAWSIGDFGFDIVLSSYVPRIIGAAITNTVASMIRPGDADADETTHWAVHPGGRAIIDKVHIALDLHPDQLTSSREILREYGNMSSATILFVLKDVLERADAGCPVRAMAFGPGLTVESCLMDTCAGESPPSHRRDVVAESLKG